MPKGWSAREFIDRGDKSAHREAKWRQIYHAGHGRFLERAERQRGGDNCAGPLG